MLGKDNTLFKIDLKAWKQTKKPTKQALSTNSCEKVESTVDIFKVPVSQTCGHVLSKQQPTRSAGGGMVSELNRYV